MWDEILPLISWGKNYSLILAQISGAINNLTCDITMATFCMSQFHESVKVLKCYEWRCHGNMLQKTWTLKRANQECILWKNLENGSELKAKR